MTEPRFEELQVVDGRLPTLCSSVVRQYYDALDRQDSSALRDLLAPRFATNDLADVRDRKVVATRGARLVLVRSGDAFTVFEIDDRERISRIASMEDIDAAFDDLEERFALGEGVAAADVIHPYARIMRACNAREWPRLRAELSDDFVLVDHRPASLGRMGPDEWVDSLRVSMEVSPRTRGDSKVYHAWDQDLAVIEFRFLTEPDDEGSFEMRHHGVVGSRGGRIGRVEFYPAERLDDALVRFKELRAG